MFCCRRFYLSLSLKINFVRSLIYHHGYPGWLDVAVYLAGVKTCWLVCAQENREPAQRPVLSLTVFFALFNTSSLMLCAFCRICAITSTAPRERCNLKSD